MKARSAKRSRNFRNRVVDFQPRLPSATRCLYKDRVGENTKCEAFASGVTSNSPSCKKTNARATTRIYITYSNLEPNKLRFEIIMQTSHPAHRCYKSFRETTKFGATQLMQTFPSKARNTRPEPCFQPWNRC